MTRTVRHSPATGVIFRCPIDPAETRPLRCRRARDAVRSMPQRPEPKRRSMR